MTKLADLAALRALLEQGTPGPWEVDPEVRTANICTIYHTADAQGWTHVSGEMGRNPDRAENTANAALIVAAVNALPALLAEVEGLRRDMATLSGALASSWYYGDWKAETLDERIQQDVMERRGWWPITEDELIAKRDAALSTPQLAPEPCPCGHGYRIVPGCCGRPARDGSCCGDAVPVQEQCDECGGTGVLQSTPQPEGGADE